MTEYLLDGDEEIAEYNDAGALLRRYVYGPAIDDRVLMYEGTGTASADERYYYTNHQGSTMRTADGSGAVTETFVYSPYGESSTVTGNPYRFTGRRLDAETGLYYYRARYYSPKLGRFLQTDPIGYDADLNYYAYVSSDPVNMTDPKGECPLCIFGLVAGAAFQGIAEVRHGSFKGGVFSKGGLQALARIAISAGAGALGGGVATQVAAKVTGAGLAAVATRIGLNGVLGGTIGTAQVAGHAAVEGKAPSTGELVKGGEFGAAFSAGGAAIGEAFAGAAAAISAFRNRATEASELAEAMVQGSQAVGAVDGLYPASEAAKGGALGATLGDAASTIVTNASDLVCQDKPGEGC